MKKQIFLAVLTVIFAFLSFYFLKIGLVKPYLLIPGLIIFPVAWGIGIFLIESSLVILVISLTSAALFLLFFGIKLSYLICAILFLFSLLWGFKKVEKEKRLRIKILIEEIVPKGISWLLFMMATIVAVGFYFSPKGQGLKEGIKVPTWISGKILSVAAPGFSQELTVDEMVNLLIKKEKEAPILPQIRGQVLEQLGLSDLNLSGQEKISQKPEILDRLVSGRVNLVLRGFAEYIPIVAAFVVWQILLFFNKILIPLVVFLDMLIYSIMRTSGFVKIKKVNVEKEEIIL